MHRVYINKDTKQNIQENITKRQIVIGIMGERIVEKIRYRKREEINKNISKSIMELNIIKNILIEYPKRKEKESEIMHIDRNVSMNCKIIYPAIKEIQGDSKT